MGINWKEKQNAEGNRTGVWTNIRVHRNEKHWAVNASA